MKKLLFIFIFFSFYFNCGYVNKEAMDKKVFDSFIGVHSEDIIKTIGKSYFYRSLNNEDTAFYLTYDKHSIHNDKSSNYNEYENPIYISTSTRNFTIFNFYKQVSFIIVNNYCTDWVAY